MKKLILLITLLIGLTSCGSYVNVSSQPRITHILAINEVGEQVQVPLSTFSTGLDPYFYHNWRFYWGNTWYWGNNWWFYFNDPFWRPRIHNFYYSHPVYYNNGYRIARNNGYRGRNSIITPNRTTPSIRQQSSGRRESTQIRQRNSVRSQTPSPVRYNQPQRSSTTRGGGRRGG